MKSFHYLYILALDLFIRRHYFKIFLQALYKECISKSILRKSRSKLGLEDTHVDEERKHRRIQIIESRRCSNLSIMFKKKGVGDSAQTTRIRFIIKILSDQYQECDYYIIANEMAKQEIDHLVIVGLISRLAKSSISAQTTFPLLI